MEKIKWIISVLCGFVATFFEQYGLLMVLVGVAIVFDLVTGLIKAKATGVLSSEKCSKGLFRKVALLAGMFFGFYLDLLIPYMLTYANVDIPFKMPFSMIISFYIVLNESISICENLYATNSEILPKWIINLLTNARDNFLKESDPENEE